MKLHTQRFIDRWVGQLLCGVVSVWVRLTTGTTAPVNASAKNILVILLSEMGSIVLAGPMFAALRRQYPGEARCNHTNRKANQRSHILFPVHPWDGTDGMDACMIAI